MRIRVSRMTVVLAVGGLALCLIRLARAGEISAAALWDGLRPWLTVAAAAALHELGHLVAACSMGTPVRGLSLDLLGARMELGGFLSFGQEFFISLCGPLVSLVTTATAALIFRTGHGGEGLLVFAAASLVLGGVNLLPVGTLDGGRMLRAAVAWLWGDRVACNVLRVTTTLLLGSLWLVAAYALLRVARLLSLFIFRELPRYTYFVALSLMIVGAFLCASDEPLFRKKEKNTPA